MLYTTETLSKAQLRVRDQAEAKAPAPTEIWLPVNYLMERWTHYRENRHSWGPAEKAAATRVCHALAKYAAGVPDMGRDGMTVISLAAWDALVLKAKLHTGNRPDRVEPNWGCPADGYSHVEPCTCLKKPAASG